MKIFISYRRADSKYVVDRIRDRLVITFGKDAIFRDIESIPLGEDFSAVLNRETNGCDVMLVVIGLQWVSITDKNGNKRLDDPGDFTRIEVETGLINKDILVIPVLVMGAGMPASQDIPESLRPLLFRNAISVRNDPDFDHDIERLVDGIKRSQPEQSSIFSIQAFEPETILIPAGRFLMGGTSQSGIPDYEYPQHEVDLPEFRIGKYPVTNKQFQEFINQTRTPVHSSLGWDGQKMQRGTEKLPVTGVDWFEALAYCKWLGEVTGRNYSLPNEAQWEKACRGSKAFLYPWGDEYDPALSNHENQNLTPVDKFPPQGEYGCYDLVGNVRQWTSSLWGNSRGAPNSEFYYPWADDDGRNRLDANRQILRVLRGASLRDTKELLRCSSRSGADTEDRGPRGARYGFRVVLV
jgi:formylglycine-generating enzyme required for sulfatase activity